MLQLWFEFASTYSYPAVQRIEALAAGLGVGVEWKPFLLGPVFKSQGWNDSPFNLYPAKGRYMWRDLERLCAKYGLPFRRPAVFPRPSLLAARVACVAAAEPWCGDFVRAVFHANFAEDRDIASDETVAAILDVLGRPGRALVEAAGAPEAKARLRAETERAIALGIFGAPTAVVVDELFWGNDRLEDAHAWAAGRARSALIGPIGILAAAGWPGPAMMVSERGMGLLDLLGGGAPGIGVGDPAPDFALPDRSGRTVRLGDYRGKKAVVLYFYPKDDTPGCTKEACSFRDQYQDFQDAGAEVIGVSSDAEASHEKFAAKYRLPFVLLADRSGAVRKQYGVPATLGLLPGRVTFVIDRQGVVRHVFNSQLQATRHVGEAIAALRALAGG